jgi:hypothetical protein
MVETTAVELAQDLEGGAPAAPPRRGAGAEFGTLGEHLGDFRGALQGALHDDGPAESAATAELRLRVEALETRVARRERVFQRLLDTLSAYGGAR